MKDLQYCDILGKVKLGVVGWLYAQQLVHVLERRLLLRLAWVEMSIICAYTIFIHSLYCHAVYTKNDHQDSIHTTLYCVRRPAQNDGNIAWNIFFCPIEKLIQ